MSMLAHLCGANEPSGRLITPDHYLVLVDNEQMFSTQPADLWTCGWLLNKEGVPSSLGIEIATELCERIVDVADKEFYALAAYPGTCRVELPRPIERLLRAAKHAAGEFLRQRAPPPT